MRALRCIFSWSLDGKFSGFALESLYKEVPCKTTLDTVLIGLTVEKLNKFLI